jgi:hypothetical protein
MRTGTLAILLVVAVVTTSGAIFSLMQRPEYSAAPAGELPAFPALREAPNSVARVEMTTREGGFILLRDAAGWSTPDVGGYPVDSAKVGVLVSSLSDMRLVAEKTNKPELYARLDLADPASDPKSSARHIILTDAEGEVLVDAFIGKKLWRHTGGARTGTYLRRAGEAETWLASGGETIERDVSEWLDKRIIDIATARLARVELAPEGQTPYEILRDGEVEPFLLPALPEGGAVSESELNRLAGTKPLADTDLPAERDRGRFITFDGLEILAEHARLGEEDWMVFAVSAGENASEETRAEAATLHERLSPWAFRVPDYIAQRVATPLEELVEMDGGS